MRLSHRNGPGALWAAVWGEGTRWLGRGLLCTYPVEQPGGVVRNDDAPIGSNHDPGGPPPAIAGSILPTRDEIVRADRLAILEIDTQELRRRRRLPVPG